MKRFNLIISIIVLLCIHVVHAQQKQEFQFALLTDLHITHKGNAMDDLMMAVHQINHTPAIEFVLVSGDITEEGDGQSLRKAKSALDQLNAPYYIVPGNHETKWSESGATDFCKIFGEERFVFEHKGYQFIGFNTGPLLKMADGHVAPQDIAWTVEQLKNKKKDTPTFIVTHYPLLKTDVDNWYELIEAVYPYHICSFIGGHYHQNRVIDYDGLTGILGRSTLRGKDTKGGYTLLEVRNDSLILYEHRIQEQPHQWAAIHISSPNREVAMNKIDYPDYSVNIAYPEVKSVWQINTGVGIYASPITDGKKVFVANDEGYVSAHRLEDGKPIWQFKAGKRIIGTPATCNGVLVFGSADHYIYGLNTKNGKCKWKIKTNGAVLGAVRIDNNIAYIGGSDGVFRAIYIKNGDIVWTYHPVKGYVETRPLIEGEKVIFGAWDNTLYALNKKNGHEYWKWNGGINRMHYSPAAVWPVAAHNKVFIADPKRALTAIDLNTGETVWRTNQSKVRETIGVSEDKKRIYSKTMNDSIVCFSTEEEIPKQYWASYVGFGYEHAPSMQIETDGLMYGSTKNGLIFALHPLTGGVVWKHKIENSLINTIEGLPEKRILYTTSGGKVGLLKFE